MKRRNLWLIGVLAAFFAASIFTTACGGLNDPKKAKPEEGTTLPEEKKPEALQQRNGIRGIIQRMISIYGITMMHGILSMPRN